MNDSDSFPNKLLLLLSLIEPGSVPAIRKKAYRILAGQLTSASLTKLVRMTSSGDEFDMNHAEHNFALAYLETVRRRGAEPRVQQPTREERPASTSEVFSDAVVAVVVNTAGAAAYVDAFVGARF